MIANAPRPSLVALASYRADRARVRTTSPLEELISAISAAARHTDHGPKVRAALGGTVPNCYAYPASTHVAAAIACRTHPRGGRAMMRWARIAANKATLSGAIAATIGDDLRPYYDGRWKTVPAVAIRSAKTIGRAGDVLWRSTNLGRVAYRLERWHLIPLARVSYGPDKGVRDVQRLGTCSAGHIAARLCRSDWEVIISPPSQGAAPSHAWRERATGEVWHLPIATGRARDLAAQAAAAFRVRAAHRAAQADEAALAATVDRGEAAGVYVCAADSVRAGNCRAGTESFATRHGLDTRRHYMAGELAALANGDAYRVRGAIIAALRRHRTEMTRGYAMLSEHLLSE